MPYVNKRVISQEFFTTSMKGPKGNQGIQGGKGTIGDTGLSGTTGIQGYTGQAGLPGSTGIRGATGLGMTGVGVTGAQGLTGLIGPQGPTGIGGGGSGDGATGLQGTTGLQGIDGQAGLDGSQGVTGLRGTPGDPGLDGNDGDQGVTGLSGTGGGSPGLTAITSQVSVTNTTNETDIATYTLSSGSLSAGSTFKFIFYGTHQNQDTSGTLTFKMYIGSNAGQVIQMASGNARAQTYMEFYGMATVRTTGATGTYVTSGIYTVHTSATAVTKAYQGSGTTSVVDTTAAAPVVKITAQWQTASATNTLLVQIATIELVK